MSRQYLQNIGLVLFLLASSVWVSAHTNLQNDTRLPDGFDLRLRPQDQPVEQWYAWREAQYALTLSGTVVGSWLTYKALSSVLPMNLLMPAASVAMDVSTSQDWYDFLTRQIFKLPLAVFFPYEKMGAARSILENLLIEAPSLVMGAREYYRQHQDTYSGLNLFIAGSVFDRNHLGMAFSTGPEYPLLIFVPEQTSSICSESSPTSAFHQQLHNLICTAAKEGVRTIALNPMADQSTRAIEVVTLRGSAEDRYIISLPDHSAPWLTESLAQNNTTPGEETVLSPFSACLLADLEVLVSLKPGRILSSDCGDLEVSTISTDNLQLLPLGEQGYLLVDHGRTQGAEKPDIWLNSTIYTHELSEQWLDTLDNHLVPGEERGPWRALSAVRSAGYRALTQYGLDWLTKTKPAVSQDPIIRPQPKPRARFKDASTQTDMSIAPTTPPAEVSPKPIVVSPKPIATHPEPVVAHLKVMVAEAESATTTGGGAPVPPPLPPMGFNANKPFRPAAEKPKKEIPAVKPKPAPPGGMVPVILPSREKKELPPLNPEKMTFSDFNGRKIDQMAVSLDGITSTQGHVVAVLGASKTGKSHVINALNGSALVPESTRSSASRNDGIIQVLRPTGSDTAANVTYVEMNHQTRLNKDAAATVNTVQNAWMNRANNIVLCTDQTNPSDINKAIEPIKEARNGTLPDDFKVMIHTGTPIDIKAMQRLMKDTPLLSSQQTDWVNQLKQAMKTK